MFHDDECMQSINNATPVPPFYKLHSYDMDYERDWRFPKTIADCAIYNTLYVDFPPVRIHGMDVGNLFHDTGCLPLSQDPNPCMRSLFEAAELNYPEEYTGTRPLSFYQDWHAWIEDSDSDSDDDMDVDTDNHPKDLPRCN